MSDLPPPLPPTAPVLSYAGGIYNAPPTRIKVMGILAICFGSLGVFGSAATILVGVFFVSMFSRGAFMPTPPVSTTGPAVYTSTTQVVVFAPPTTMPAPTPPTLAVQSIVNAQALAMGQSAIALLLAIVELWGGIGLVRYRAAGLRWLRRWAWWSIGVAVLTSIVLPILMTQLQVYGGVPASVTLGSPMMLNIITTVAGQAIACIFPVLVLILLPTDRLATHLSE
ncbi:MAG: hypothetical protein QM770_24595 [Tepidisphaeraceae bacterium]